MERTKEKIRQYIVEASMSNSIDISDDTLIFEQGYLDSMGLLFLVQFLKEEFEITTSDHDLVSENFESISAIASFLQRRSALKEDHVNEDQALPQY
jgi:acyl carrier protein